MALEQKTEEGGSKCATHPTQPHRGPFDLTDRAGPILQRRRPPRQRAHSLPTSPEVRALDRYLRYRDGGIRYGKSLRPHHSSHLPNLWLGPKGAFTESGTGQMIHERGVAAGLGDHVHPHMFRRTYAHKMLAGGMNETDLMTLAGWRSRTVVSRYAASAAAERATEIAKRMSPGDTL